MASRFVTVVLFWLITPRQASTALFRHPLTQYPGALCTDGSQAAYYRTWTDSYKDLSQFTNYIIFLQGGGYCPSVEDCHVRCGIANHLCTSEQVLMKENNGILSDDTSINPGLHDFFKVELPYCSGDMFIGNRPGSPETDGMHFVGRKIFDSMVDSLKQTTLIEEAENVVLSGSSAGGAGVVFNCEHLQQLLPGAKVWCIVDAAFFYPVSQPFHNATTCQSIDKVLMLGADLWGAPQLATFDLNNWWNHMDLNQELFLGASKFDLFGFESFCGDFKNDRDRKIWGEGLWKLSQRFLAERPNAGLFSAACRYHMVLHTSALFNRLNAGATHSTYAQAITRWLAQEAPSSYQIWDDCLSQDYCNPLCDSDGKPDTLMM